MADGRRDPRVAPGGLARDDGGREAQAKPREGRVPREARTTRDASVSALRRSALPALAVAVLVQACSIAGPDAAPAPTAPKVDPRVLAHYDIRPDGLPTPFATPSSSNPPAIVPQPAGASLVMPPGFTASVWAEGGFRLVRWAVVAPNGDVFVTDSQAGTVLVLRDEDKDGKAETRYEFASGLKQPFGLAFSEKWLYVGNTDAVVRFAYAPGQTAATGAAEKIADLPGKGYREHWTRNVVVSPDGSKVYATVGSESNVSVEPDPRRAAIIEMNPDGSSNRIFASGTRNPIGLAFNPTTRKLWAAV